MIRFSDPGLVADAARVVGLGALAFVIAMLGTPFLSHVLYKYRFAKSIRTAGVPVFASLHKKKEGTPTGGGVLIWATTGLLAFGLLISATLTSSPLLNFLSFLSRRETVLPLAALIASAVVGLVDDYWDVRRISPFGGGLRMRHRLFLYAAIASIGAWWFFVKLGWDRIHVPAFGDFVIGGWYIPLFILVVVATAFSVNEADGLDGLAGGILLFCFGAYAAIAFTKGLTDLAAFCAVIIGALLAFLWFNVYPARFFMGDTGSMSLGVTLGIMAMLTNSALVLPIIAFPLVVESLSVIIQVAAKKLRGKKVFLSTPIHHHFEATGWPETKVTMRFWILAAVSASLGTILGILGAGKF
ncbi:MAG: Phospho-N-acetylmuramoyl-pentapeptide-transferase [Parcubacteria group bacterium Gr01-1014_38]|nr:MAG: Phospho-N-acetylmuramoyl-pentapeptide-transferase [Parcubacteria group bacterium Gr01-1014_38]